MNYQSPSEFLYLSDSYPIIDVRAPKEFEAGHIPNAINLPLFSDEERAVVGTLYKQKRKLDAIPLKGLILWALRCEILQKKPFP
jgi:tRNA 2-selenouridine synthase